MNTLIVHPKNQAQEKAVKAVLKAMDIAFEKVSGTDAEKEICVLPPHVIEQVKKAEEQLKNGNFSTHEEVKNEFRHYL